MSELRSRILEGVAWNAVSQIGNQAINLGVTVLLMRLLPASAFGLVAMAGVITGFFLVFPGLGLGASLVQKADAEERHYTSIYWVNILVGIALAALVALVGPLSAWFFHESKLTAMLAVLSLQFPISAFGAIQRVHLRRELKFNVLFRTELLAGVCGGACGVACAVFGAGAWSLVARSMVTVSLSTLFVGLARPYRAGPYIDWSAVRECAGFGMNTMGRELLAYFFRNVDNLLIGKYLGAVALGLYSRAYTFMLVPLLGVTHVIAGVLFPAFAQIQRDETRMRAIFLRTSGAIALVAFPTSIWFMVAADPFVHVVLGPRWKDVGVLLQILCPTGIWECFGALAGTIYMAKDRTDLHLRVTFTSYFFALIAFVVGLRWGLEGVSVGYVVASASIGFPSLHFARKLLGIKWTELLAHLGGVLFAASIAGVVAHGVLRLSSGHLGQVGRLAVTTAALGLTYAWLLFATRPAPYRDVLALLRTRQADVVEPPT